MKGGSKRERNNVSVQLCRKKKRKEKEETQLKTEKLKDENSAIETSIEALAKELDFLTEIMNTHAVAGGNTVTDNTDFGEVIKLIKK